MIINICWYDLQDGDDDDGDGDDDDASEDDDDGDASSIDEMSTWHSYPLLLVTKRGSSFDIRVVIIRRRVSIRHFVRGSVDMRDVVRILYIFYFPSFIDKSFYNFGYSRI